MGVAGWNTYRRSVQTVDEFGMLLGPEETPVRGFSWCRSWLWLSNAGVCVRGGGCGVGVWLCVECCIVDASIFFVG